MSTTADIAIIGAGAAGLMAAIWAGRSGCRAVVVLDGARSLGAKILVAGGGRCNVTHDIVDEKQYAGSTPPAIRNVLRRFDVPETIDFFRELGVELKREDTGKLFPVTDDATTVLHALLRGVRDAGGRIVHPWRVDAVKKDGDGFTIHRAASTDIVRARKVVLATGGKSLPKSGSDGAGFEIAKSLGHTITPRVFPALVPLVVGEREHRLRELSGIAADCVLEVRSGTGKVGKRLEGAVLITHFGYSGPGILDISRYLLDARAQDDRAALTISWIGEKNFEALDADLARLGKVSPGRFLSEKLPERLARALCAAAGVDPSGPGHALTREARRRLAQAVCAWIVPCQGDRGWNFAEVTAGGVRLAEVNIRTMESRPCPGLYLCGEICDVDGRIGGYNFQWAWASGFVAGSSAAAAAVGAVQT